MFVQNPLTAGSMSSVCTDPRLFLSSAVHTNPALVLTDFDECNARANETISVVEGLRGFNASTNIEWTGEFVSE